MERECASGQSSESRVQPAEVDTVRGAVLVRFFVEPLPPADQTCQGNPATRVTVVLGEPLGDRALLDSGWYPPREPSLDG